MSDLSGYKNIFKTTFLFGFVQVFNIFVKVGINKVVAILLGTAGSTGAAWQAILRTFF